MIVEKWRPVFRVDHASLKKQACIASMEAIARLRGDRGDLFRARREARGSGRDASRGDLAAHHSARPGNTLQSICSQMDRCVHNGLIDNPLPPLSPAATGTAKFQIHRDI